MSEVSYLRNRWYVAALAQDLTDKPLAASLMGEPIVFYRDSTGEAAALEDRCAHRQAPLSLGVVDGDRLRCGYHGFEFDCTGACVRVPTQAQIPPAARVRAYPVRERQGFLHVWMGDPAKADESLIYDFPFASDDGWRVRYAKFHGKFGYRLLVDNLMDLTHLPYAHPTTIGAPGVSEQAVTKVDREGENVTISRYMENIAPAPAQAAATDYYGNVDRWQVITFTPPGFVWLQVGSSRAGTGGRDAAPEDMLLNRHTLHVVMPETDATTSYFWCTANEAGALTEAQEDAIYEASLTAFNEDIAIIEGQHARWDPTREPADVAADAGMLQVQRLMKKLIADEAGEGRLRAV
jgi:phenylpropionate dioxygenase-like ring-hydroxylating dioxygenase large terminal subunit